MAWALALAAVEAAVPSSAPEFIGARAPAPPLVLRPKATVEAAADRDCSGVAPFSAQTIASSDA